MNPLFIAGAGVGVLLLVGQARTAGAGLKGVSAAFGTRRTIGGVTFSPPASASAVATFEAMRDAQQGVWGLAGFNPKAPSVGELRDICNAWLEAYQAGCKGGASVVTSSVFGDTTYNLSMLPARIGGSAVPGTCSLDACSGSLPLSPLGKAVCDVSAYLDTLNAADWSGDEGANGVDASPYIDETYRRIERMANELDAADFTVAGARKSDDLASFSDIPGAILNAVAGMPVVWVLGLGAIAFVVLR